MNFNISNLRENGAKFAELTRAYSLLTSIAPWFTATGAAAVSAHYYSDIKIKLLTTVLSFVAVICVHLGGNLFDDYSDIKKKLKEGIPLKNIDFENAKNKGRLIINGTYSLAAVKKILAILFGAAILIGAYFTFLYGVIIPVIAVISGILCILYPFSSKYYAGELVIGLLFGPLLVNGTYLALTGRYMPEIMILSIAIGLMTVVLLDTHSLMDFDFDKRTGKNTLCILAGTKKRALALIAVEILISYAIVLYLAISGQLSLHILWSIAFTAPLAFKLIKSLNDYNNVVDLKFIPKWYLGPMENWDLIKKQGYEYFMYRFYIARNIGFIFCTVLSIALFFTIEINYIYI